MAIHCNKTFDRAQKLREIAPFAPLQDFWINAQSLLYRQIKCVGGVQTSFSVTLRTILIFNTILNLAIAVLQNFYVCRFAWR